MAGEAQVDEPFFVQALSRLFQQLYLFAVVLDELVVCKKDSGDTLLNIEGRKWNRNVSKLATSDTLNVCAGYQPSNGIMSFKGIEPIFVKPG